MKKHFFTLLLIFQLALSPKLFAQNIAINTTGNAPDTSAMLDITSTTQGFLMPRMATVQMNAIALPAKGLLIFNTSLNLFEVNLGTPTSPNWTPIGALQTNIYTADGILGANRTVEMNGNYLQLADSANTSDVTFSGASQSLYNWSPAGRAYFQLFAGTSSALNMFVDGGNAAQVMSSGTTSLNIGTNTSAPVAFYTNNNQRASIDTNGNVGIGTGVVPNSTLEVSGSLSLSIKTISGDYTATTSDYTIIKIGATPVTITLPDPTTCPGRLYEIISYTGTTGDVTFSQPIQTAAYSGLHTATDLYELVSNVIGASAGQNNTLKIQSDGNNWYSIGL